MQAELSESGSFMKPSLLRSTLREAHQCAAETEALVAQVASRLGVTSSHSLRLARAHALSLLDELDGILAE